MLIVTGATGRLGRLVLRRLLDRAPAARIGVSTRDPAAAADLAALGVRVRRGDFADPASLRHAFEGAERLLLISTSVSVTGGDAQAQHRAAIQAAKDVGVRRLLYTAQVSTSPNSLFPPGREHAATERMLEASGLAWTSLRHGFYAGSAVQMNRAGFARGVLAGPRDGKTVWTTHEDLAEADAAFLMGEVEIDGPTRPLTGSEALDFADLAALASERLGRPATRQIIDETAMAEALRGAGLPEPTVQIMLGYYRAAEAGEFVTVDPTLAGILGRPTTRMREYMREALAST